MIDVRLCNRFDYQIVQILCRNPDGFQGKSVRYDNKYVVQADIKVIDGHCAVLPEVRGGYGASELR